MTSIRDPLVYLNKAIDESGLNGKVRLALDVAASSFYEDGFYKVDGKDISKAELMEIYENLIQEFNLLSIEDPFYEEDFESFRTLKEKNIVLVVGDDLTVTNKSRLEEANKKNSVNALIIKPNQVGTLSETLDAMKYARDNDLELIVSHRSGEVEDEDFIADLAYAFNCFGLKTGAPTKKERVVKYKRLIEILEIQKKL
jgi:enolase